MMCAGSLMIAIMPTYVTIGAWAPVLLLIARLTQGLSVGGEYGTAATYMSEVASKGNRGFYSSFQYVTLIGGQLLALLVLAVLQMLLTTEELKAWGWRIPFVIGAMAAIVAMLILGGRQLFICDTYVNPDPSPEQLAELTLLAAEELRRFGLIPSVALLSHSSFGSADTPSAQKMRNALALIQEAAPDLAVEGEMHGDAALAKQVLDRVFPGSGLTADTNLLIMSAA